MATVTQELILDPKGAIAGLEAEYYSDGKSKWFPCTMCSRAADGGINVDVGGNARKIEKNNLKTHLQPSKADRKKAIAAQEAVDAAAEKTAAEKKAAADKALAEPLLGPDVSGRGDVVQEDWLPEVTGRGFVCGFICPLVLFLAATFAGMSGNCFGTSACPKPEFWVARLFDIAIRYTGPGVALPVLGLRWWYLPFSRYTTTLSKPPPWAAGQKVVGLFEVDGFESYYYNGTVAVWTLLFVTRFLLYFFCMGSSKQFADHIFLMMSILPLLQIELVIALWAIDDLNIRVGAGHPARDNTSLVLPIAAAWITILLMCYEAYNTARFFHTNEETERSLGFGAGFFIVALAWLWQIAPNAAAAGDSLPPGVGYPLPGSPPAKAAGDVPRGEGYPLAAGEVPRGEGYPLAAGEVPRGEGYPLTG